MGGYGIDTADYSTSAVGVVVAIGFTATNPVGSDAEGDAVSSTIENVTGSAFNDLLVGSSAANTLSGGAGNDILRGGAGGDTLNGGDGIDTADYSTSLAAVLVQLADPGFSIGGHQGGDALGDILSGTVENLTGSAFNDDLRGSTAANLLNGGAGNDVLRGGGGADVLIGGAGSDVFRYTALTDSTLTPQVFDQINDFALGADKVDVSAIDTNTALAGDQGFTWQGSGAFAGGGVASARYVAQTGAIQLHFDQNGDGATDMFVLMAGLTNIGAGDLIL
jgi:Ca2+-binding RTX toxin-like protein